MYNPAAFSWYALGARIADEDVGLDPASPKAGNLVSTDIPSVDTDVNSIPILPNPFS